jgi:hypothetical protein
MPTDRQLDDRISRWLEAEAPAQLPDRVLRATFERTRGTRQRAGWHALLRRIQVNRTFFALATAAVVVVAVVLGAGLYFNNPGVGAAPSPSPTIAPSPDPTLEPTSTPTAPSTADLVTEEVEPGVVRIRSDGAGHDLEERHPTLRYDMDNVFVTPDGTVWVSSSYSGTDNEANPAGGLVWALGQSETTQYPATFCFPGAPNQPQALGVTCYDPATDTQTKYLVGTQIIAVAAAPDGTFWAVGSDGAENGGLYHITP